MKKIAFCIISLLLLWAAENEGVARDINLDEIYIRASSRLLHVLVNAKLDAYQEAEGRFVDSGVAFTGWFSGKDVVYVKEFPGTEVNAVCTYDLRTGRQRELFRITGTVMALEVSADGRHIIIKRMVRRNSVVPDNELFVYYIPAGRSYRLASNTLFMDFSLAPEGNSMFRETGKGIEELALFSKVRRIAVPKIQYSLIVSTDNPSVAYFSPGRNRYIVMNGGGGRYRGILFGAGRASIIKGITSPKEFFFVDNNTIACRKGYTGHFFVALKNLLTGREERFAYPSLNTSLYYSRVPGILSFTKDQMIQLYMPNEKRLLNTGIEGEDVSFSTDGVHFTALICSRLFIVNRHNLIRKRIGLRRSWRNIMRMYRELESRPGDMDNEFSAQYIGRKISIYSELLR